MSASVSCGSRIRRCCEGGGSSSTICRSRRERCMQRYCARRTPHADIVAIDTSTALCAPGRARSSHRAGCCRADRSAHRRLCHRRWSIAASRSTACAMWASRWPSCARTTVTSRRMRSSTSGWSTVQLPAVVDPILAAHADAPVLHPAVGSNVVSLPRIPSRRHRPRPSRGRSGRARSPSRYPRNSITPDGRLCGCRRASARIAAVTMSLSNFQGPFSLHPVMARALRIPGSRLRHRSPPNSGGSFGSKLALFPYIVVLCIATRLARRPIKWIEDRLEHLAAASAAPNRVTRIAGSLRRCRRRVSALRLTHWDDHGAYLRAPMPAPIYRMHGLSTNAYGIKHVDVFNHILVTNKCPTGAVRGFGGPQLYFAIERMMQSIAVELGLDPLDVIRRNLIPGRVVSLSGPGGSADRFGRLPAGRRGDRAATAHSRSSRTRRERRARGRPALRHRLCGRGRAEPVEHGLHLDPQDRRSSASAPARRMGRSRPRPSTSIRSARSAWSPIPFRKGRGIRPRSRRSWPTSSACALTTCRSISRSTPRRTAGRSPPATTPAASRPATRAPRISPRRGCARSSRALPRQSLNVPADEVDFAGGKVFARRQSARTRSACIASPGQAHWSPAGACRTAWHPRLRESVTWSAPELTPTTAQ